MKIYRPDVPSVPAEKREADTTGDAPDLSGVPVGDHEEAGPQRPKPHIAVSPDLPEEQHVLTGAELKTVVAAIADAETVCFIDVGEGQRPVLIKVAAGIAIVGRK